MSNQAWSGAETPTTTLIRPLISCAESQGSENFAKIACTACNWRMETFDCSRFNVREGLLYESSFLDYAMAIQKEELNIVVVFLRGKGLRHDGGWR